MMTLIGLSLLEKMTLATHVSQLELYSMKNLHFSKQQCERKGFTKKDKIEEIKKHFYRSTSSINSQYDEDGDWNWNCL